MGLTAKQQAFVLEYMVDLNATQAAIRAGYSERSAHVTGCRLLKNANVVAAIAEAKAQAVERNEVTVDRIVQEISHIAFQSFGDAVVIEHGVVCLDLNRLSPDQMRAIKTIRQKEVLVGKDEDTGVVQITDVEFHDKLKGLDMLMKRAGGYAPIVNEHTGAGGAPLEPLQVIITPQSDAATTTPTPG